LSKEYLALFVDEIARDLGEGMVNRCRRVQDPLLAVWNA